VSIRASRESLPDLAETLVSKSSAQRRRIDRAAL